MLLLIHGVYLKKKKVQINLSTNQIISRQDYHFPQPCQSEEKQTNKQKLSINLTL